MGDGIRIKSLEDGTVINEPAGVAKVHRLLKDGETVTPVRINQLTIDWEHRIEQMDYRCYVRYGEGEETLGMMINLPIDVIHDLRPEDLAYVLKGHAENVITNFIDAGVYLSTSEERAIMLGCYERPLQNLLSTGKVEPILME